MTREECMEKLAKEVSELKGIELIYVCDESNNDLAGNELYAYVAQADLEKGITIRGNLPKKFFNMHDIDEETNPDGEVILECCNSYDDPDDSDYLRYVLLYIEAIKSGKFKINDPDFDGKGGGNSAQMELACAFN